MSLLEGVGELVEEHPWPLAAAIAVAAVLISPRVYRATARPVLKGAIKEYLALRTRVNGLCAGVARNVRQTDVDAEEEVAAHPPG